MRTSSHRLTFIWLAILMLGGQGGVAAQAGRPPVTIDPAQGRSLDDLAALATAQAPGLLAARARAQSAQGSVTQAGLRPNPTFSFEQREGIGDKGRNTAVGLSWPLDLFRRSGRVLQAESEAAAATAEADFRDWRQASTVRTLGARTLAALRLAGILDDIAASYEETLSLIAARVETGAAPPIDRDIAAVEAARARADARRQHGEVDAAAAALRAAVGLTPDQPLVFRNSLEDEAASAGQPIGAGATTAEAIQTAVGARPDIRLADVAITQAQAGQELARRDGRYNLNVFGAYMRMKSGFPLLGLTPSGSTQPIMATFNAVTGGVMVMLPVRNRNQGALAAAVAAETAARHEREARTIEGLNEVAAAMRREQEARAAADAISAQARELAARNVEVQRESYNLGRATLLDVLTETRRRFDLEAIYTAALLELLEARIALVTALGGGR